MATQHVKRGVDRHSVPRTAPVPEHYDPVCGVAVLTRTKVVVYQYYDMTVEFYHQDIYPGRGAAHGCRPGP